MAVNHRLVLTRRPEPALTPDCFALDEAPVPEPAEGRYPDARSVGLGDRVS